MNLEDYYTDYYFIGNTKFSEIMSKFKEEDNPYYTSTIRTIFNGNTNKFYSPVQNSLVVLKKLGHIK